MSKNKMSWNISVSFYRNFLSKSAENECLTSVNMTSLIDKKLSRKTALMFQDVLFLWHDLKTSSAI